MYIPEVVNHKSNHEMHYYKQSLILTSDMALNVIAIKMLSLSEVQGPSLTSMKVPFYSISTSAVCQQATICVIPVGTNKNKNIFYYSLLLLLSNKELVSFIQRKICHYFTFLWICLFINGLFCYVCLCFFVNRIKIGPLNAWHQ